MLSGCAHTGRTGPPPAKRTPNIVVILADDLGVGDVHALNPDAKIPTPHLDALVREGMAFTDAHSASAVCTPSRYALLTGRYAWRTTLQRWVIAPYEPPAHRAQPADAAGNAPRARLPHGVHREMAPGLGLG